MKAPIMTIPGSSRLCEINQRIRKMKRIIRDATVIQYEKYLQKRPLLAFESMRGRHRIEGEGGGGRVKRHIPRDPNIKLLLHGDEIRVYSQDRASSNQHYQEPEIELDCRPVISSPPHTDYLFGYGTL